MNDATVPPGPTETAPRQLRFTAATSTCNKVQTTHHLFILQPYIICNRGDNRIVNISLCAQCAWPMEKFTYDNRGMMHLCLAPLRPEAYSCVFNSIMTRPDPPQKVEMTISFTTCECGCCKTFGRISLSLFCVCLHFAIL